MLIILSIEEGIETMCNKLDKSIKEFEAQELENLCLTIAILGDLRLAYAESINDYLQKTYSYPSHVGISHIPVLLPAVEYPIPASAIFLNSQRKITDWQINLN